MADQMVQERTEQQQGQQRRNPLQSSRGMTHIDDSVVSKIAGIAAQEIEGVQMGGGTSRTIGGLMDKVTGGGGGAGQASRGVSVEVGEVETAIDLTLAVQYGKEIPQITETVRRNVIQRVENLIGLRVTEVNVTVDNVYFAEGEVPESLQRQQDQEEQQQEQPRVR